MAKKVGEGLSGIIDTLASVTATAQIGVNRVLWGSNNPQPIQTVKYDPASGSLSYAVLSSKAVPPKKGNIIESGLFNALDVLNQVDLCNVITYLAANTNVKKKERPQRPWSAQQAAFFGLQDAAGEVVRQIDKYTTFPSVFIGAYTGLGPNALPADKAVEQFGAPAGQSDISGTAIKAFNMYNLLRSIDDTMSVLSGDPTQSEEFTDEERELMGAVPGLSSNANFIRDFLGGINKYTDYRSISNSDLQKLDTKVTQLRSVCVAIQSLNLAGGIAAVGNLLGIDVRKQIQQISKFIDPNSIAKTLKDVNSTIKSFVKIVQKMQSIIRTAQFMIKLSLLFIKIFKFIVKFLTKLPLPNMFTVSGVQSTLDSTRQKIEDQLESLTLFLKQVNSLLTVVNLFIRYLLSSINELLTRLQTIQQNLQVCDAMKDSDVLTDLNDTVKAANNLKSDLEAYTIAYESRNNSDTSTFGEYLIKVVDEEVTDPSIPNKRRRGIALDVNGVLVVQSDLTFATDTQIIINEVILKLKALGLVQDSPIDATIAESLKYLDDDVLGEDITTRVTELDPPDNENEDKGLGLNAFINSIKGGKKLRSRVRNAMAASRTQIQQSVAAQDPRSNLTRRG